ncbi:MAG: sulfotransferase family 2 domain-containing protein [Candidatus Aminicenantes bacterium]|nr:sulfotransferase family 2 domain-containing protein [Candidatus Aminicenantes bacterium]
MMVSNRKRFVFVHIPKTGGSSIFRALSPYNDAPDTDENRHLELVEIYNRYGYLAGDSDGSAGELKKYFKFAFVRNPWDRVVSMYSYRLSNREIPPNLCFSEFVLKRRQYPFGMHREQVELIEDQDGKIALDFIGRLENLEKDWSTLQSRLGISSRLPHLKQTSHQHYQTYYNRELRDEIAGLYPRDIKTFGYRF